MRDEMEARSASYTHICMETRVRHGTDVTQRSASAVCVCMLHACFVLGCCVWCVFVVVC